jgi:prevent-host-death family protein
VRGALVTERNSKEHKDHRAPTSAAGPMPEFRAAWTTARNCGKVDWSFRLVKNMRVQASEAKTHLPELLDKVEQGETIVITRHGRAIARLVPETDQRQAEIDRAIEGIKALQKTTGKITVEELLSARHEGHKY